VSDPTDSTSEGELLWEPSKGLVRDCRLTAYRKWLQVDLGLTLPDYQSLWEWSTSSLESFWESLWRFFEVKSETPYRTPLGSREMPGASWFPGATLNYAEHALGKFDPDQETVVAISESGARRSLSGSELRRQVGAVAAYLTSVGVAPGDRVAAYLPNIPEAVVAFLACASIGAVWSSCSPDFGERAVLDRFQQIEPVVLFAVDGYRYGGRDFDRRQAVARLREGLPTLRRLVVVPNLLPEESARADMVDPWSRVAAGSPALKFLAVPFDHPLWVVYSSGTTGLPKPIVHGHGGILLEHLKALGLHADIGVGSRFFWFTTTGWMMWNYLLGALLLGASVVLYDGSPVHPDPWRLWKLIGEHRISHFGTSAGHISASMKAGLRPGAEVDLSSLRFLGSTGSALAPEGFAWAYRTLKSDLWLSSLSGGTDLCTAFLLGCPWLPVRSGVMQCRGLGAKVEAFDQQGLSVVEEVGELVISAPMPSMPLGFWGDHDGHRYQESYFDFYPGLWRHGDWIRIRADGGAVIYGRSDSTINRNGVRMGTSEIYQAVEGLEEIRDSLVVDVAVPGEDPYMPLFVVLSAGVSLDPGLVAKVRGRIRETVSPRHVPDVVVAIDEVPRTLSGKKLEIPVKRLLQGASLAELPNLEAVQNPRALDPFVEMAAERSSGAKRVDG
jgi:acetoacetyl-CoA synthetase